MKSKSQTIDEEPYFFICFQIPLFNYLSEFTNIGFGALMFDLTVYLRSLVFSSLIHRSCNPCQIFIVMLHCLFNSLSFPSPHCRFFLCIYFLYTYFLFLNLLLLKVLSCVALISIQLRDTILQILLIVRYLY